MTRSTFRFDLLVAALLAVTVAAFFSDLWAHAHGRVETFFTPWHLALYSSAGAVFLVLAVTWARGVRAGAAPSRALPDGYGPSLVGAILFVVGGGLDLLWHTAFGIEANISALFSPTHILLFSAGVLMTSGPLRASWRRGDDDQVPWARRLPMVVSLALVLSVLTAMTLFIAPVADAFAERPSGATTIFSELYTMNPDGSRQTRLLFDPALHYYGPRLSSDGTKIAFLAGASDHWDIMVANGDGSGARRLETPSGSSYPGSWSPDGERLAVVTQVGGASRIEIISLRDGAAAQLTAGPWHDANPAFSPDGSTIAFASDRTGHYELFTMRADGSALVQLTRSDASSWGPAWSPDGRQIAFSSTRNGGRAAIYVFGADGAGLKRLSSSEAGGDFDPAWSPDGRRIAFSSNRDGNSEIYVMNADGSSPLDLTRTPGIEEGSPAWSTSGLVYQAIGHLRYLAVPDVRERLGLAGVLVASALIAGLVLLGIGRGGLPFGAVTIVFGVNTALMSVLSDEYRLIPGAVLAGLACDALIRVSRPDRAGSVRRRIVAFFVPASYFAAYLTTLAIGRGIDWPVHLWTGSVVLAGAVGVLASYLLDPPVNAPATVREPAS